MRFLKRQTINRRQLKSTTVYSDVDDANVYINPRNSGSVVLPLGTNLQQPTGVRGMMRYNVDLDEIEVYQGSGSEAGWRTLRYKESTPITNQFIANGDGANTVFGPLSPQPAAGATGPTWNETQYANQLIVLVGNVIQIANSNYFVIDGADIINAGTATPGYPYTAGQYYIQFTGAIPGALVPGEPVTVLHGFDK